MANMTREEVSAKVCDLVKQVFRTDRIIDENTHFVNDLKADSLDLVELVMEVEEAFDVRVDDEAVTNIHTVKEVVDALMAL